MTDFANSQGDTVQDVADEAINQRLFRTMAVTIVVATGISIFVAPWRVTSGIALGGALSLFNFNWMRGSIAAAFRVAYSGKKPQIKILQYLLRYFVIAAVILVVYKLNVASLTATMLALCSFVPALFAEAIREFYFAIVRREEVG